jgi:hypothetical protein
MGAFAERVGKRLRAELDARSGHEWVTERRVGRTPVDVATRGAPAVLVELEFRRADPANNTVKLARHASEGTLDECVLLQAFSGYYDTESGVSSKRENAEFVGGMAAESLAGFSYRALDMGLTPPRGGDPPENWTDAIDALAAEIASVDVDTA